MLHIYDISRLRVNNSNTNKDIATKQTHTTDTFLFVSHTTNVLLFKFRYNFFIGVRIIKEMPGLVASGTPCITRGLCDTELRSSSNASIGASVLLTSNSLTSFR